MRMWNVDPQIMCRKHLLGEHNEMHMIVGAIKKGISIKGYIDKELIDTSLIQERHDTLAREMLRRKYNHKSPMNYEDILNIGKVTSESLKVLLGRCVDCRKRASERIKFK